MKKFLLPLAIGTALSATSVVANAFEFAYVRDGQRICLVPEAFSQASVYWSAIKPNGKCDGSTYSPIGGAMNIRNRRDLGNNLWARLKQAAAAEGLDSNFTFVYCRQNYQGNGGKLRWNFVVKDTATKGKVPSGWIPDGATKCTEGYDVPLW